MIEQNEPVCVRRESFMEACRSYSSINRIQTGYPQICNTIRVSNSSGVLTLIADPSHNKRNKVVQATRIDTSFASQHIQWSYLLYVINQRVLMLAPLRKRQIRQEAGAYDAQGQK